MTQDEIIEMARQVGFELDDSLAFEPEVVWYISQGQLEAFAKLVTAKAFQDGYEKGKKGFMEACNLEREACAKLCEAQLNEGECPERAQYCADAIRARGQE